MGAIWTENHRGNGRRKCFQAIEILGVPHIVRLGFEVHAHGRIDLSWRILSGEAPGKKVRVTGVLCHVREPHNDHVLP
jgi:hypothetical protein